MKERDEKDKRHGHVVRFLQGHRALSVLGYSELDQLSGSILVWSCRKPGKPVHSKQTTGPGAEGQGALQHCPGGRSSIRKLPEGHGVPCMVQGNPNSLYITSLLPG